MSAVTHAFSSFFEDYENDGDDNDGVYEIAVIINKLLLIQNIAMKELIISLNEVNTTLSLHNGTQGKGFHYKWISFLPFHE